MTTLKSSFKFLTRRERLSKLGGLGLVLDNKSVKVARASDLELDRVGILLDASRLGILSAGNFKELLDILNLLRLLLLYKC
jgi:hypothetical protein